MWDYSKCYNSVKTTEKELHGQQFVWRLVQEETWKVYGIDRKHFGDKCTALGLDIVKKKVARAGRDINEAAVKMIEKDYVVDGFGGGTDKDVVRLMGKKKDPRGEIMFEGTVPTIMARGGFYIKYMVRDGEDQPKVLEQFGGAILGIPWHTRTNIICMKLEVNLSKTVQKIRQGQSVTPVVSL